MKLAEIAHAHTAGTEGQRNQTMRKPKQKTAPQAIEEALEILRSSATLEGKAKESVEVLLEVAVENLRASI